MEIDHERVVWENELILAAVQAMLGLISPEIIAISVGFSNKETVLRFWVTRDSAETEETVSDALGEMEAYLDAGEVVKSETRIGPPALDWPSWAGRMIYWAKE